METHKMKSLEAMTYSYKKMIEYLLEGLGESSYLVTSDLKCAKYMLNHIQSMVSSAEKLQKDLDKLKMSMQEARQKDTYTYLYEECSEGGKYSHINFKPPAGVSKEAQKGLDMRSKYGRGGTAVGIARARDLSNRKDMSPSTIKRMVSFFARHEQNKNSKKDNGEPGNGKIAWLLWGGDSGKTWSEKVLRQMEAADKKAKAKHHEEDKKEDKEKKDKSESKHTVRVGQNVRWRFGNGYGRGVVKSIHTKKITRTIQGTKITRNGTKDNPAVVIEDDGGGTVLKLEHELLPSTMSKGDKE